MFGLRINLFFLVLLSLTISKDMPQTEGRFLGGKAIQFKRHIEAVTIGKYSFKLPYIYVCNIFMPPFLIMYFSIIKIAPPTTMEPQIIKIFAPEGLPFDFWG